MKNEKTKRKHLCNWLKAQWKNQYVFDQEGKFKKLKRKIQKIKNLILQRLSFYV